jgi:hypothetical protein
VRRRRRLGEEFLAAMLATKKPGLPVAFGAQAARFIHLHPADRINGHTGQDSGLF